MVGKPLLASKNQGGKGTYFFWLFEVLSLAEGSYGSNKLPKGLKLLRFLKMSFGKMSVSLIVISGELSPPWTCLILSYSLLNLP